MTIETRLKNLENLVDALSKKIDRNTFYSDADTAGVKKNVGDITPYTASATAYIDDTQVIFSNVPSGNISVFMMDGEGNNISHTVEYVNGNVVVMFEKRESLATVNISIS